MADVENDDLHRAVPYRIDNAIVSLANSVHRVFFVPNTVKLGFDARASILRLICPRVFGGVIDSRNLSAVSVYAIPNRTPISLRL
jgi:hypothetical protein